jgi:hypothetical protein
MLRSNLDELEQTIQLLQSDNTDEFFDVSIRNKKYGRVDATNGPVLLEKYASSDSEILGLVITDKSTGLRNRFRVLVQHLNASQTFHPTCHPVLGPTSENHIFPALTLDLPMCMQ